MNHTMDRPAHAGYPGSVVAERMVIVEIAAPVLAKLLHLPPHAQIERVEMPAERCDVIELRLRGVGYTTHAGDLIARHQTQARITMGATFEGDVYVRSIDWALPEG